MISFIIPLRYKEKDYIYERAIEFIDYFSKTTLDVELVLSDSSKKKLLQSKSSKVKIVSYPFDGSLYSPAKARNEAIKLCSKKYIFFLDVDLFFSETFIESLVNIIKIKLIKEKLKFLMLPCLYLSPLGTKVFEQSNEKKNMIDIMRTSYIYGDNKYVERLAVNTSAIVLEKNYFTSIGMFSEDFDGHGGEDFELLHRLASYSPHSMRNEDYYLDIVEQFPADYRGFRKYLSIYSLEYFFSDLLLVHRWHKRELFNQFYMKRVKNESLLLEKMKQHDLKDNIWLNDEPFRDYKIFLNSLVLKHGYDEQQAIGFNRLQNNIKIKRPLGAKVRKLITRPRLFFVDMLHNWIK